MTEAEAKLAWLPAHVIVVGAARHLGCTPEAAELRIIGAARAGRIKARGAIVGRPVSLLPAAWNGTVDLTGATLRPPGDSCEIENLELCLIDSIAAGLLPAPVERTRWSAAEAIAYLLRGVSLPWEAWQGAGASPAEIRQAEIDLGELAGAGLLPAWGWHPLERRRRRIPADHFRDEMIGYKAIPVSVAHRPKVIVRADGNIGTSPLQRSADYRGPRWERIEFDSAALRRARSRPLAPAADAEDQDGAATAAAAGTKPKKRRGTRGPPPKARERVKTAMKNDIRAGRLTIKEGRLFRGGYRVLQKELTAEYACSTGTLRDAQDLALLELKSELETPTKL
jgi:hypothetical protein